MPEPRFYYPMQMVKRIQKDGAGARVLPDNSALAGALPYNWLACAMAMAAKPGCITGARGLNCAPGFRPVEHAAAMAAQHLVRMSCLRKAAVELGYRGLNKLSCLERKPIVSHY